MDTLTEKDLAQLQEQEIPLKNIEQQMRFFEQGIAPIVLVAPATIGAGIEALTQDQAIKYVAIYQKKKKGKDILKFVPASGAATRMFKHLFEFKENFTPQKQTFTQYVAQSKNKEIETFFRDLEKFAFFPELQKYISKHPETFSSLSEDEKKLEIIRTLLEKSPFNYGNKPKGLLPFHKHSEKVATAFEEHFREAVMYAAQGGKTHMHFTISEAFTDLFLKELAEIRPALEKRYGITFEVSFSSQKSSTDTVAATPDNHFFRTESGELLFRPAGHGALLKNLGEMNADIIFIKNIDNVVIKDFTDETTFYKEVLAGKLEDIRSKCHKTLRQISKNKITKRDFPKVFQLLKEMNISVPSYVHKFRKKHILAFFKEQLNRPIRVCGMVKNEGEPGGGPFWVQNPDGTQSLQIVESAQVELSNPKQRAVLESATHFNPVDLVCCIKNYKGEVFILEEFSNPEQGFISQKTYQGRQLKALELPGLWNGAMANWITLFVEVPLITFNPVKTVNDLLKETHQG